MIGNPPNPCPELHEGLALGAREHQGFCATWNWIVDIFKNIKSKLVTDVNGRTGKINIIAGSGIDVIASGNNITIGLGGGNNTDNDNPDNVDPNGGGGVDDPGVWQNEKGAETSGGDFGSSGMFKWYSETREIGVGGVMIGRRFIPCTSGMGPGLADNTYQLKVTLSSGGAGSCQVVADSTIGKQPTTTECWIPIYTITDGVVTADYRGAFVVPVWE